MKPAAELFCSLVNQVKIPFIDFGHTNLLPTEMRKHMNASVIRAISPNVSVKLWLTLTC